MTSEHHRRTNGDGVQLPTAFGLQDLFGGALAAQVMAGCMRTGLQCAHMQQMSHAGLFTGLDQVVRGVGMGAAEVSAVITSLIEDADKIDRRSAADQGMGDTVFIGDVHHYDVGIGQQPQATGMFAITGEDAQAVTFAHQLISQHSADEAAATEQRDPCFVHGEQAVVPRVSRGGMAGMTVASFMMGRSSRR